VLHADVLDRLGAPLVVLSGGLEHEVLGGRATPGAADGAHVGRVGLLFPAPLLVAPALGDGEDAAHGARNAPHREKHQTDDHVNVGPRHRVRLAVLLTLVVAAGTVGLAIAPQRAADASIQLGTPETALRFGVARVLGRVVEEGAEGGVVGWLEEGGAGGARLGHVQPVDGVRPRLAAHELDQEVRSAGRLEEVAARGLQRRAEALGAPPLRGEEVERVLGRVWRDGTHDAHQSATAGVINQLGASATSPR
jgi:hypothetical protein